MQIGLYKTSEKSCMPLHNLGVLSGLDSSSAFHLCILLLDFPLLNFLGIHHRTSDIFIIIENGRTTSLYHASCPHPSKTYSYNPSNLQA